MALFRLLTLALVVLTAACSSPPLKSGPGAYAEPVPSMVELSFDADRQPVWSPAQARVHVTSQLDHGLELTSYSLEAADESNQPLPALVVPTTALETPAYLGVGSATGWAQVDVPVNVKTTALETFGAALKSSQVIELRVRLNGQGGLGDQIELSTSVPVRITPPSVHKTSS